MKEIASTKTDDIETDDIEATPTDPSISHDDGISSSSNNNKLYNISRTSTTTGKKRLIAFMVVMIAIIVTAIGLTIVVVIQKSNKKGNETANADNGSNNSNNNNNKINPEGGSTTDSGTNNDSIESRFDQIVTFLSENAISSQTNLLSTTTPQYKAASFMANNVNDNIYNTIPVQITNSDNDTSYLFIQRYVMIVFYYAMNGNDWIRSANFIMTSSSSSSNTDTCDWNVKLTEPIPGSTNNTIYDYGVSCYNPNTGTYGDRVTYIFLRT
jgi:hypothetical protein